MKTNFVTLSIYACLALAAADVSHLASSYLPPPKPEQVDHMTIEQHELRELPEQVDFMRDGAMEMAPSSQLTPPAMPQAEQMLATRYLPPAEATMAAMPAVRYLPPAQPMAAESQAEPMMQPELMPAPAMESQPQAQEQPQPQAAPAMRYLPPAQQAEQPQYIYQQYQEQQPQEQQMPYILDVQQPMAPSDAETLAFEPEPAHDLRQDGYHYKQAAGQEQRLRH